MQYQTPTVGLAMSDADFLKFCSNYKHYFECSFIQIPELQKKINNEWGIYDAYLDDIKIEFRHFRDINDAIEKWERRKKRVIEDNIIIKFSYYPDDDESIDADLLMKFSKLPFKKIVFSNTPKVSNFLKDTRVYICSIKGKEDNEFIKFDKVLKLKEIKEIINA